MQKITILSQDTILTQQLSTLLAEEQHDFFALDTEQLLIEPEDLTETAIVLLDVATEDTVALPIIQLFKSTTSYQHIDIIVLVEKQVYLHDELLASYLNAGAIDYILKPIRELILKVRLRTVLQRHSFIQEITQKNVQFAQQQLQIIKQTEEIHRQREIAQTAVNNLKASLTYAQRIQSILLPENETIYQVLPKHFIFFRPKDIVSGDFYWIAANQQRIVVVVADCTGHGVPGAFMSMIGFEQLHDIVHIQSITSPDELLNKLHIGVKTVLRQDKTANRDGMDVAVAVIDVENATLEFAAAKNPLYYVQHSEQGIISSSSEMTVVRGDMLPVGGVQLDEGRNFEKTIISLNNSQENYNSIFYLFSDGYQDQFGGEKDKKFSAKRFRELLFAIHEEDMEAQRTIIEQTMATWIQDRSQIDDMLVLGFRIDNEVLRYLKNTLTQEK